MNSTNATATTSPVPLVEPFDELSPMVQEARTATSSIQISTVMFLPMVIFLIGLGYIVFRFWKSLPMEQTKQEETTFRGNVVGFLGTSLFLFAVFLLPEVYYYHQEQQQQHCAAAVGGDNSMPFCFLSSP